MINIILAVITSTTSIKSATDVVKWVLSQNWFQSGDDIEVRLLVPSRFVGRIIGRGGHRINGLRSEFDAYISISDSDCCTPDSILTISADMYSVLQVVNDVIQDINHGNPRTSGSDDVELCLLVYPNQVGCIIGVSGSKIKNLQQETGTHIKIFSSCCSESTDRVCQISGYPSNCIDSIRDILELIKSSAEHTSSPYNCDDMYGSNEDTHEPQYYSDDGSFYGGIGLDGCSLPMNSHDGDRGNIFSPREELGQYDGPYGMTVGKAPTNFIGGLHVVGNSSDEGSYDCEETPCEYSYSQYNTSNNRHGFGNRQNNFGNRRHDIGNSQRDFVNRQHESGISQRDFGNRQRDFGISQRDFGNRQWNDNRRGNVGNRQRDFSNSPCIFSSSESDSGNSQSDCGDSQSNSCDSPGNHFQATLFRPLSFVFTPAGIQHSAPVSSRNNKDIQNTRGTLVSSLALQDLDEKMKRCNIQSGVDTINAVLDVVDKLEDENTRLKEARLCKICHDLETSIVFIPCGHLVACDTCGAKVKECPICRRRIKESVRTFCN